MVVAVDSSGVAIGKSNLYRVVPHLRGGLRARLGLEHGKRRRRNQNGSRSRVRIFFISRFVARRAGAFFPQIGEFIVAAVTIGPRDVHACTAGDMDFYARGFLSLIDRRWHVIYC